MKVEATPRAEKPAGAPTRSETHSPRRILLVDGDDSIRQLGADVLIDAGYNVAVAEDGAAAWQTLNADRYDLLITDNNMPHITGIDLLKLLRDACMELPVIMATGALPMMELLRDPRLQPAAALIKPYSPAELLGAVKMVLREADKNCSIAIPAHSPANTFADS